MFNWLATEGRVGEAGHRHHLLSHYCGKTAGGAGGTLRNGLPRRKWGGVGDPPLRSAAAQVCFCPGRRPELSDQTHLLGGVCERRVLSGMGWAGAHGTTFLLKSRPELSWVLTGGLRAFAWPVWVPRFWKGVTGARRVWGTSSWAGDCLGISLHLPTANQTRKKEETKRSAS